MILYHEELRTVYVSYGDKFYLNGHHFNVEKIYYSWAEIHKKIVLSLLYLYKLGVLCVAL
jgi:hypothetical protein